MKKIVVAISSSLYLFSVLSSDLQLLVGEFSTGIVMERKFLYSSTNVSSD